MTPLLHDSLVSFSPYHLMLLLTKHLHTEYVASNTLLVHMLADRTIHAFTQDCYSSILRCMSIVARSVLQQLSQKTLP